MATKLVFKPQRRPESRRVLLLRRVLRFRQRPLLKRLRRVLQLRRRLLFNQLGLLLLPSLLALPKLLLPHLLLNPLPED
jgi:hypothetical protein